MLYINFSDFLNLKTNDFISLFVNFIYQILLFQKMILSC